MYRIHPVVAQRFGTVWMMLVYFELSCSGLESVQPRFRSQPEVSAGILLDLLVLDCILVFGRVHVEQPRRRIQPPDASILSGPEVSLAVVDHSRHWPRVMGRCSRDVWAEFACFAVYTI